MLGRNHHDDDAPVELTEDDLNDPDLLAQLAELTGGGGGGGLDGEGDDEDGKEPSPTAAKNPGIKPSSPSKSITTQISSSPSKSLASTISSSNHSSPVKSSQSPLLTPSPSTSGSSPAVRSASPIPVAPTPLKQAFQPQTAASPPKSSNPTSTNASKPITFESVKSTTPSAAAIAFTTNTSSSSLTVQAITDRQKELKDMAVLYKKANDTESAKNILVTAKSLEAWKDLLKKGKMQLPPSYKVKHYI